jgi:hypothetical protein
MRWRRGRGVLLALTAVSVLIVAGCGRDDFENDPRPPVPDEITVKIGDDGVLVSPAAFGAGLVNFTIANLSDDDAALAIEGPTTATSDQIPPGGNAILKTQMESGSYQFTAEGPPKVEPFQLQVGPERASGQNDLLLP